MSMTHADYATTALCLWREARGEGHTGMTAVACVIRNRVARHNSTPYAQVVKPWAFSSMTAHGDPQLTLFPAESDANWQQAQLIGGNVLDGLTADITQGATLYWNPKGIATTKIFRLHDGSTVPFPEGWNVTAVAEAAVIGNHVFLRETP